jgi:hypothetical protein
VEHFFARVATPVSSQRAWIGASLYSPRNVYAYTYIYVYIHKCMYKYMRIETYAHIQVCVHKYRISPRREMAEDVNEH